MIFSLVKFYQYSDAIVLLENDKASTILEKVHKMKKINMNKINEVLSKNVTSSLLLSNNE